MINRLTLPCQNILQNQNAFHAQILYQQNTLYTLPGLLLLSSLNGQPAQILKLERNTFPPGFPALLPIEGKPVPAGYDLLGYVPGDFIIMRKLHHVVAPPLGDRTQVSSIAKHFC